MNNRLPTVAPNLDRLRTFVVFASHLNFVRAAEALDLSQPAVHAQVAKLADHYGAPLYQRSGRALHLTDVGRRVRGFAVEILDRSARFHRELEGAEEQRAPTLAADAGTWLDLLAPELSRGLAVRPSILSGPDAEAAVRRGEADLGVVLGAARPGLDSAILVEAEQLLAARADHRAAQGPALLPRALGRMRLIAPPRGAPQRDQLDAIAAGAGTSLNVVLEVRGRTLTLRFVQEGLGVAVVDSVCGLPDGVVARPIRGLPTVTYRAIRRPGALRSPGAEEAWRTLRAAARRG